MDEEAVEVEVLIYVRDTHTYIAVILLTKDAHVPSAVPFGLQDDGGESFCEVAKKLVL